MNQSLDEIELRNICQAYKNADGSRHDWGMKLGKKAYEMENEQLPDGRSARKLLILKIAAQSGLCRDTINEWLRKYKTSIGIATPVPLAEEKEEIAKEETDLQALFELPNIKVKFVGGEHSPYYRVTISLGSVADIEHLAGVLNNDYHESMATTH